MPNLLIALGCLVVSAGNLGVGNVANLYRGRIFR